MIIVKTKQKGKMIEYNLYNTTIDDLRVQYLDADFYEWYPNLNTLVVSSWDNYIYQYQEV